MRSAFGPASHPASTSVHGPWQIAATGFPESTKSRTNETAQPLARNLSGFTVPPGSTKPSNSSTDASDTARSTADLPSRLEIVVARLDFTGPQGQHLDLGPGSVVAPRVAAPVPPSPHRRRPGWRFFCPATRLTSLCSFMDRGRSWSCNRPHHCLRVRQRALPWHFAGPNPPRQFPPDTREAAGQTSRHVDAARSASSNGSAASLRNSSCA